MLAALGELDEKHEASKRKELLFVIRLILNFVLKVFNMSSFL